MSSEPRTEAGKRLLERLEEPAWRTPILQAVAIGIRASILAIEAEAATPAASHDADRGLRAFEEALEREFGPDCRRPDDWEPESINICAEHSEILMDPDGCEDSPRGRKDAAIRAYRAALASSDPEAETRKEKLTRLTQISESLPGGYAEPRDPTNNDHEDDGA